MLAGIPRSSEGDTRISIGRLVAGSGRNVVPAHAVMQIETRGSTEAVNNYMVEYAKRIVEGNAHSYDVKVTFEKVGEATTLVADEKLTEDLTDIAKRIPFIHSVDRYDDVKGSEDCTMIGRKVRSHGGRMGFFMFGCNQNRQNFSHGCRTDSCISIPLCQNITCILFYDYRIFTYYLTADCFRIHRSLCYKGSFRFFFCADFL